MEKMNLSDLLEPEHMDPVKRIALIRIVDDDGGAVDFLTKPVVDEKLLSSIDRAVARSCEEAAEAETVRELAGLWQALSPRECQVAQLAAEGLTTKAVSDVLGIAERTAQVHVAHVCSKLGVENAVGVAQIIARLRARGVLQ